MLLINSWQNFDSRPFLRDIHILHFSKAFLLSALVSKRFSVSYSSILKCPLLTVVQFGNTKS